VDSQDEPGTGSSALPRERGVGSWPRKGLFDQPEPLPEVNLRTHEPDRKDSVS